MIHRNGTTISTLVQFPSGLPDGSVAWAVFDEDGLQIDNGSFDPPAGAVSAHIVVPSAANLLAPGNLLGFRDLVWSYMVGSEVVNGDARYILEARPPYGPTPDGVRYKLGVEPHELPDEEISLVRAYYQLLASAGNPDLTGFTATEPQRLALADAIEAVAALNVVPTLQVRIATKESSGTDTFQRQTIDWAYLADSLRAIISAGIIILDPAFDPFEGFGDLFLLATPAVDPITGAAPA
jgi:hypothetical protein